MSGQKKPAILLIDDEVDILSTLRRTLRPDGYEIVTESNPREALTRLREQRFDVVVCDVDMPELNGLELLQLAKKLSPATIRIVLTGKGSTETTLRAINEGEVHRFLLKPYDPAHLRELIAEAIERRRELGIAQAAAARADSRQTRHRALERRYPGICQVERDSDGGYVLGRQRAKSAAGYLGLSGLFEASKQ